MRGAKKSVDDFGDASDRAGKAHDAHGLSLRKIESALASYVGHAIGANRVTEVLGTSVGSLALGGGVVTGVLLGVGAIIAIYEKLTESTRKAKEEQKKLTEALAAQFLPKTGPRSTTNKEFLAALQTRADLTKELGILQTNREDPLVENSFLSRKLVDKQIRDVKSQLDVVNQVIADAYAGSVTKMETVTVTARNMGKVAKDALAELAAEVKGALGIFDVLTSHSQSSATVNKALISDYKRISEQIRQMGDDATPAKAALMALREELAANLVVAREIARVNSTGTVGPLVGKVLPGVSVTPNAAVTDAQNALNHTPNVGGGNPIVKVESAIERQTRLDAENQQRLRDVISNTAAQTAQIIGNAILSFGSGRGSQIGGALGGAIGGGVGGLLAGKAVGAIGSAYIGAAVGSVIPVVGTILGGFIGSALGGLFGGHKKAVDTNTQALRENTAALLLNAPSGFKVAAVRYDATHVRAMGVAARKYSTRGGFNPLLAGT